MCRVSGVSPRIGTTSTHPHLASGTVFRGQSTSLSFRIPWDPLIAAMHSVRKFLWIRNSRCGGSVLCRLDTNDCYPGRSVSCTLGSPGLASRSRRCSSSWLTCRRDRWGESVLDVLGLLFSILRAWLCRECYRR